MTGPDRLRLAILGADPALASFRMSCCMVVAMALVCGALVLLSQWFHMPRAAYVLGLITTMQGTLQINDRTASARAVTRIYAAMSAIAAVAAISAVHDSLRLISLVLLVVVFLAIYIGRFGNRWRAVGVFTFMCAVVAAFLKGDDGDLKAVVVALVISGIIAHLVRNFLIPDKPDRDFRRVISTILSVSREMRGVVSPAPTNDAAAAAGGSRQWKDLQLAGKALSTAIRTGERYLPLENPDEDRGETTLALRLLDLELASETLIGAFSQDRTGTAPPDKRSVDRDLKDMEDAETALEEAFAALPPTFSPVVAAPPSPKGTLFPKRGEWLKDPGLRQALQVTLACAIATVIGEALSTERWFWAVMTAFLTFTNAQSGGAVAVRGLDRAWGTALGIVIGIGLATLTHEHIVWTIILLAVCVSITFFIARVSYVAMSVFLTIALSLIYGLMGVFTPALLVLRLEETAVGAASGALVALLLFPTSIREQAIKAMNGLLNSLADLLQALAESQQSGDAKLLAGKVGAVDGALGGVLAATEPMRSGWAVGSMTTAGRDTLREAYLMAYAAHRLENSFRETRPTEQHVAQLLSVSQRLKAAATAGGKVAGDQPGGAEGGKAPADVPESDNAVGRSLGILSNIANAVEASRRPA